MHQPFWVIRVISVLLKEQTANKTKKMMKNLQIILKNGSFRNIENLQFKKTANSVLLSLFIRTNGKCNKSHAPSTRLGGILLSVRTQYSGRTRI